MKRWRPRLAVSLSWFSWALSRFPSSRLRIQAAGALRLALVEEHAFRAFIAAAAPHLVLVRIEGRLAVAVGGPGAVEML